jgi:hypothetical protein
MDIYNPERFFADFPNLPKPVNLKSPHTRAYNCIAFALGFENKPWWPPVETDTYWPAGCPREETVSAFEAAFATLGYKPCSHERLESGYEKIALFTDEIGPTHAAIQLPNGIWASKCGGNVDIEHKLRDLEGPVYGKVTMFFRRHRKTP